MKTIQVVALAFLILFNTSIHAREIKNIEKKGFVQYLQVNMGQHDSQTQISIKTNTGEEFYCEDIDGAVSSRVLSFINLAILSMEKSYEIYESEKNIRCSIGVIKN
ncbi:TPA: hypothetical protein KEY68_001492 [Providencia rettgeri]|uniref:hypothetical protein n=1 Tax=Providencia TaxID=586 RepID=UPI001BA41017|nr:MULTISPECIES: hypothetical protein [Providencia]EMB5786443.1 hypothetical protein [Providencia rettgeri]MDK7745716.1 hypothetical protein [Providencia rettgeri]MDK7758162.1 hypothetical protein [Providencia rettgeri]HBC7429238.1 hypothetical protein [Providencia rettgeri]